MWEWLCGRLAAELATFAVAIVIIFVIAIGGFIVFSVNAFRFRTTASFSMCLADRQLCLRRVEIQTT